jgi:hypothetical protein
LIAFYEIHHCVPHRHMHCRTLAFPALFRRGRKAEDSLYFVTGNPAQNTIVRRP